MRVRELIEILKKYPDTMGVAAFTRHGDNFVESAKVTTDCDMDNEDCKWLLIYGGELKTDD